MNQQGRWIMAATCRDFKWPRPRLESRWRPARQRHAPRCAACGAACRPACHAQDGVAGCFSRSKPCFFPGVLGEGYPSLPPRHSLRGVPQGQPMRSAGCQPLPLTSVGTAENLVFLIPRRHASSSAASGPGSGDRRRGPGLGKPLPLTGPGKSLRPPERQRGAVSGGIGR